MSDLTLVTLLGSSDYKSAKYNFGNNKIITNHFFSLALFEKLSTNNKNITKLILIGSKESKWDQFYSATIDFIKNYCPKSTDIELPQATIDNDRQEIISSLQKVFSEYLHCELIDVVYDSSSIIEQNNQVSLVENIIKLPMTKNIVFDPTLGFRFIPWLVFTALEYKTYIDNSLLNKVYYAKIVNKTNNEVEFKSIELNMSTKLFKEALDLNAYNISGELTPLESYIDNSKSPLKKDFLIANLAENFGCYDIANEKFRAIKQELINEFEGSIAFNKDFFNNRLNWINDTPQGNLIRLSEHFFNTNNYTDCILTAHQFGKINKIDDKYFKELQNKFRTQIIHMININNFNDEDKFKDSLKKCLDNITKNLEPDYHFTINNQKPQDEQGVLISIIGSGNYYLTDYNSNLFNLNNVKYFGTSLAFELKKQNKIEKLFICGIHTSNWNEFLESLLKFATDTTIKTITSFIDKHKSSIENPNATGPFNKYYLSVEQAEEINKELQDLKPELGISIEIFCYDDKDEDSGDFSKLLEFTKKQWNNTKFYLDITHGYRAIPFIMFFAFLTICSRNNNEFKNIYYGFSDYNNDRNTTTKGWIADETHLLKLIKYSFEINKFNSSGNFLYIKDMLDSIFNNDTEINAKVLTAAMNENLHKYFTAGKDFTELKNLLLSKEIEVKDNFVYKIIREPIFSAIDQLRNKTEDPIDTYIDRVEFFLSNKRYAEATFSAYETFRLLGQFVKSCYESKSKESLIDKYNWIKYQYNEGKSSYKASNGKEIYTCKYDTYKHENYIVAALNRGFCINETYKASKPLNYSYFNISNYRRVITNEKDGYSKKHVCNIIENNILLGDSNTIAKDLKDALECIKMYREFIRQFN
ncbi:MAG: hypothetical protein ACI4V7_07930 [Succinivibrionaceae bacterium]